MSSSCSADSIVPRVLQTVVGSGPFGERADAKFWTLAQHAPSLTLAEAETPTTRTNIDIGGGLAFKIDSILSRTEADALVEVSERMGFSRFAPAIRTPPGMRQNKAAHWIAPATTAKLFLEPLYQRFAHLLPTTVDGAALYPRLSHRLAHYKYDDGDVFNKHTDGQWPGQAVNSRGDGIEEWEGVESRLSMLLYLSDEDDGVHGGATRLFPADGSDPVDVAPRKGSALFFRHGFGAGSVLHAGQPVSGTVPKHVVRLNVLYEQ